MLHTYRCKTISDSNPAVCETDTDLSMQYFFASKAKELVSELEQLGLKYPRCQASAKSIAAQIEAAMAKQAALHLNEHIRQYAIHIDYMPECGFLFIERRIMSEHDKDLCIIVEVASEK